MRVFYNHSNTNFGDHLNAWMWPRLIPGMLEAEDDRVLVGVGSLLKADLDRVPGRKLIFGTGSGYGPPPTPDIAARWDVYAVRGPLTAEHFGFAPETAITDGAWLIALLPEYADLPEKTGGTVFIPHWTSAELGNWEAPVAMAGFDYIDPLDDGPSVLNRIATADLAIVESLHGAIFADYFRTPWVAVTSATRVLHYKWIDWCRSLDMDYAPYMLPPSDAADFLTQGQRPAREMPPVDPLAIDARSFAMKQVSGARRDGPAYRAKIHTKRRLRAMKDRVFDTLRPRRDLGPFGRWNERYRDDLAAYLTTLASVAPHLSGDAVRAQRIEELAAAFERFKADQAGG